jgi:hypothetical protein
MACHHRLIMAWRRHLIMVHRPAATIH